MTSPLLQAMDKLAKGVFFCSPNEKIQYKIVGKDEADLKNKLIYFKSPIGKGLIGKQVGDIADIVVPNGTIQFEILKISL